MGLDATKRPIASVASNPGHCLASGIIAREHVLATADRLMRADLVFGWGIRTLSPSIRPTTLTAYHRGSVWPVEQGSIALGLMRYGLHAHLERLAAAVRCRVALRARTAAGTVRRPRARRGASISRAYLQANAPQAWSASTIFLILQALLGLYPHAPSKLLFLDPHLPVWLPDLVIRDLRVGEAAITLRFRRTRHGQTAYRILNKRGDLHVIRQASPWSLTETVARRAWDLVASALPAR